MKHFFRLLTLMLLSIVTSASVFAQFHDGSGTEQDPYQITLPNELALVRDYCGSNHADKHFRLMNDIDLSTYLLGRPEGWIPIGSETSPFTGYFHGGGYEIKNMKIDSENNYVGLFGYSTGIIDSVGVSGESISGGQYSGGLVGYNTGTITGCYTKIEVHSTFYGPSYSGGLTGYNTGVISHCYAEKNVETSSSSSSYSGGLVGYTTNDITNCYAKGSANAKIASPSYSGGLIGYLQSGKVTNCYATGMPRNTGTSETNRFTGTVIGYNLSGSISDCYYNKEFTGTLKAVGNENGTASGQSTSGMQTADVFVGWDFTTKWGINSGKNGGYPYLRTKPLRLATLTINIGTLAPVFHSDTLNYKVDVESTVGSVSFTATATITGVIITGNTSHTLLTGSNPIKIEVSHDGGKLIYTVTVHKKYSLTLDPNYNGATPASIDIVSGINILPEPSRIGYTFVEWNTKPGGDSIAYNNATVQDASGISTLYAQWTANKYYLKFDTQGKGTNPQNQEVTYDKVIGDLPSVSAVDGYKFDGWNTKQNGSGNPYTKDTVYKATHDTTLYAQWTANEYKIKFDANEGVVSSTDLTVTYNEPVGTLPDATRTGYEFKGWNIKKDGTGDIYTSNTTVYKATHDTTLYAQWTANEYTLSFDANYTGGSVSPTSKTVTYDNKVGELPPLGARPNYTFKEWNTKPDGKGTAYTEDTPYTIAKDTTLYAQWKGTTYNLTFDPEGGTVSPTTQPVDYGSAVGTLPEPSLTGYDFGGWFTESNGGGTEYTSTKTYDVANSITLHAKWTAQKYKIKFDADGGSTVPNKPVTYNAAVGTLDPSSRTGYDFGGWFTEENGDGEQYTATKTYQVTHDTTLYAKWTAHEHTLTFNPEGGTVSPTSKSVKYGSAVGELPTPILAGYKFEGWFTVGIDGEQYTATTEYKTDGDTELHAKWTAEVYELSFNANYSGGKAPDPKDVTYDAEVGTLDNPDPRPHYTFEGWNTKPDGSGDTYTETTPYKVAGNTPLYAQWKGAPYTLTFQPEGGTVDPASKSVNYGSEVGPLPVPVLAGYQFGGWFTATNGSGTEYTPTKTYDVANSIPLHAKWTAQTYTLIFNAQGGISLETDRPVTYNSSIGTLPVPTRAGYTFNTFTGWNTAKDGSGTQYSDNHIYNVADNTTLYAQWTGNNYTISFDSNGGDAAANPPSKSVVYGSLVGPLPNAPGTRANYTFDGWNTKSDGTGTTYTADTPYEITPPGNGTLYAKWTGDPYVLTFEPEGGTVDPESKTVNYGAKVGPLPTAKRPGYTFNGWFTATDNNGTPYTEDIVYDKTGNTTIYAKWTLRYYTIKFVNYDGGATFTDKNNITYGQSVGTLPTPDNNREHYTLKDNIWNTKPDGTGINIKSGDDYYIDEDVTLYAQWIGDEYQINFNANYDAGVVTPAFMTVHYGSAVGDLPNPIRTGYEFKGWNAAEDGSSLSYNSNTPYMVAGPIPLYAQWKAKEYVLNFEAPGDPSIPPYKTVTYDAPVGELPVSTQQRPGYTFNGWNTMPDGSGTTYTESHIYKATSPTTVYAQWKPNQYKIGLNAGAGGAVSPASIDVYYNLPIGTSPSETLPVPTRTGYDFNTVNGWNTSEDGSGTGYSNGDIYDIVGNKILYAQWTPKKYNLSFDANGGSPTPASIPVTYDAPVGTLPANPARTNYDFSEWNTAKDGSGETYTATTQYTVAYDATLYAQWTPKEYVLSLDAQNGTVSPQNITVTYKLPVGDLPEPTRTGYEFVGWFAGANGSGTKYTAETPYTVSGPTTIYAQWKANEYTIGFNSYEGSAVSDKPVTYDAEVGTLTPSSREGYTFGGWFTAENGGGTEYTATTIYNKVAGDITLHAKWTGKPFTLSFDANEGSPTPASIPVRYGEPVGTLPDNLTLANYTFSGWNTAKNGSGDTYTATTPYTIAAADATLYAQWKADEYVLSLDAQGGTVYPVSKKVTYNSPVGDLPDPARTGYTFAEWNAAKDGSGQQYDKNTVYTASGNATVYAKWTANPYTINFNSHGGSKVDNITVTYDAEVGYLPVTSRTGYTFGGWFTAENGGGTEYAATTVYRVADDITLHAKWTVNPYTISFNSHEGSDVKEKSVNYGAEVGDLPPSLREGYEFGGWFTEPDGDGDRYIATTPYRETKNITLHAKWTGKQYNISFDAHGGSAVSDKKNVRFGDRVGELPPSDRTGYNFDGWFTAENGGGTQYTETTLYNKVAGDITLHAKWTAATYTISFDTHGGSAVENKDVIYDARVGDLTPPTREGYTFGGWFTDVNGLGTLYTETTVYRVAGSITLHAKWTADSYTLSFDVQGGNPVKEQSVIYGAAVGVLPQTSLTGYAFGGWFTETKGDGVRFTETTVYETAGNRTLYARWTANKYELEFNVNYAGGVNPANQSVVYEEGIISLPVITRPGYTFNEWNTAQDGSGTTYTAATVYKITGNTTLYAQWTVNSYTIGFDVNYTGGINPQDQGVVYDVAAGILPSLDRTGYTFKGWNTERDGSGVTYTATTVYNKTAGDIILYAQWTGNTYTLSFDAQGGVPVGNQPVVYNASVGELPTTSRTNYTFAGWFTGINGGGTEYIPATVYDVTDNTLLYAKWTPNAYVINFDTQGGGSVSSLPVTYGAIVGTLPVPVRSGYTFKGWNTLRDGSGTAYTEQDTYVTNGNTSLYAQWTANSYKLSFVTHSDQIISDRWVTYNVAIGALPVTSRTGYTFGGWFTAESGGGREYTSETVYEVADSTVLHAKWIADKYSIVYDLNYIETTDNPPTGVLPSLTRQGYTFNGWNTEPNGSGETYLSTTVYMVTGNTTLYAQWSANSYTLAFEANYTGSVAKPANPAPQSVVYGAAVGALPAITRAGYIFNGWNTAENGSGETYTETSIYSVTGNTTLYAQWTGISYTVSFTGDNVSLDPQTVIHGEKAVKPSEPTREGYIFNAWYKDNDAWDFNAPVTGDMLLTARWISTDAVLKSLTVSPGTLTPEFKPSITDYTVVVSYDVATISVTGLAHHSGAAVRGNVTDRSIGVGDNVIKVTVTAEDGVNTMIYTVLVTRADHIIASEANILNLTANNRQATITGNVIEYVAACGENSVALNLTSSPHSTVLVNGDPYAEGQVIPFAGDVTEIKIRVTSETGKAVNNYTLKVNSPIDESRLYYHNWPGPDILSINANPDNNGGYEVTDVRWFRWDDTPVGTGGYIAIQGAVTGYYAEIKTVGIEGWHRVCGVPTTKSLEKITAYPNPVPRGESVKLKLPASFVGGVLNIYDIRGALLKSGIPLTAETVSIDVSNLGSSIYLFGITGREGDRQTVKMIVE